MSCAPCWPSLRGVLPPAETTVSRREPILVAVARSRVAPPWAASLWIVLFSLSAAAAEPVARPFRQLAVMHPDGSHFRELVPARGRAYGSPCWSPDGKQIAYSAWNEGQHYNNSHVFVASADATQAVDLGRGTLPHWSPDGKQIVFQTYGNTGGVMIMNRDGKGREMLKPRLGCPRFSPDGRSLAFLEWGRNIGLLDTVTLESYYVLPGGLRPNVGFEWAPDAKRICFLNGSGKTASLNVATLMQPGFRSTVRVITRGTIGSHVSWSPDGHWIVFAMRVGGEKFYQLYRVAVDGESDPERIPDQDPTLHNQEAAWSPDGAWLLFVRES